MSQSAISMPLGGETDDHHYNPAIRISSGFNYCHIWHLLESINLICCWNIWQIHPCANPRRLNKAIIWTNGQRCVYIVLIRSSKTIFGHLAVCSLGSSFICNSRSRAIISQQYFSTTGINVFSELHHLATYEPSTLIKYSERCFETFVSNLHRCCRFLT